jgi:alkylation response protein AidB-like acyl-CoA dehydrogenase
VPEIFKAEKTICLAISEAFAGSDVSNLRCEAKKSEDGKEWIINGHKKCVRAHSERIVGRRAEL